MIPPLPTWHNCLSHKVETPVIFGIPCATWSAPGETCLSPGGGCKHFWCMQQVLKQGTSRLFCGGPSSSSAAGPKEQLHQCADCHPRLVHHPYDHLPREARMDVRVNSPPHAHPFHKDLGALPKPSYWPLLTFLNFKWRHRLVHLDRLFCCPGTYYYGLELKLSKSKW